jgi:hypothetical protein
MTETATYHLEIKLSNKIAVINEPQSRASLAQLAHQPLADRPVGTDPKTGPHAMEECTGRAPAKQWGVSR